ncbi:MAG: GDP-mannose 4,6-dehydratase [candidate division Zixibacteria bacterium]|nr:GDP-mannose 4,6-dehydratase [candidate division Zixibacteria bacterium]
MKVLITGIAGFVGSHLAELLLKKGDEVFGICLACESLENIREIKKKLHLTNCDITDFNQLSKVIKKINPDEIYHLAALSSVGKSFAHPTDTIEANVSGTLYLLEILRNRRKEVRILIVGSSDMYGVVKPKDIPITEEKSLLPISPYGSSKAMCDLLAYQYFKSYGVQTIRVRAFNHTGARQGIGFVVPDFASQLAKIEAGILPPAMKVGNVSSKRDISDVRDIVRGYQLLMKKGKAGEAYNICSGKAYSIKNVLKVLVSLSKKKIRVGVDEKKNRPAEIPVLVGDNSKIKRTTGWKPEISIEKTLEDTLNFWRRKYT